MTIEQHANRLVRALGNKRRIEQHAMLATLNMLNDSVSIVRISEDGIEHIAPEDFYVRLDTEEARLAALSDDELRREMDACEMEDPNLELLFGEAEWREMDL